MAFPSKRYVDRAVQTSHTCSTQSCTQFSTPGDAHRVPIPSSGCNELSSERQVAHTESGDERSHLETLETCFSDDAGSTRSAYTRTGIGSRCPSERIFQPKRLNSLPNASGTTEHSLGRADNRARIVSMPERDKLGNLEHPVHTETSHGELSDSTDISYYSADSDQGLAGQKSDVERLYPADLPQTPSPPSSPDSVMIIANGGQVAGCFLRRSSTDDDGWTSWASSPPRPIPALHGPLSLPYARCPSGAEGTVVDGDDLSNKIWGLGIQDEMPGPSSRSVNPAVNKVHRQQGSSRNPPVAPPLQRHDTCGLQGSFLRGLDTVIDLSKPSTYRHSVDPLTGHKNSNGLDQGPAFHSTMSRDIPEATPMLRSCDMRYGHSLNAHTKFQRTKLPENVLRGNQPSIPPLGLGLNWNGSSASINHSRSAFKNDPRNRLNTAAPVFVPARGNGNVNIPSTAYSHPVQDYNGSPTSRQRETQSRAHTSSHYRMQQDYILPTPSTTPSTASPRWSSVFSQSHEITKQKSILSRYTQQLPVQYSPKIYSPQLDADNHANRLRLMMEQLRGDHLNYNPPNLAPTGFSTQKNTPIIQPQHGTVFERCRTPGQNELVFLHNNNAQEFIPGYEMDQPEPGHTAADDSDIAFSSERRRNLSYQHPRSIPLARLIQRRLSAVVEEDVRDSLLPMLRQRASQLPVQLFNRDVKASAGVHDTGYVSGANCEDAEEKIESAVSVEDPPTCPGFSGAVVNLPRNATAAHPRENYKPARNNLGSRKENIGRKTASANEHLNQSKAYNRQRKSDTPLRSATNPTL